MMNLYWGTFLSLSRHCGLFAKPGHRSIPVVGVNIFETPL